jgi:hypothetical protein
VKYKHLPSKMAAMVHPASASECEPATTASATKLRALMYNCGLFRLKLFGFGPLLFANPPFADERFTHLAKALLDSNADVIALQEIYEKGHVNALLIAVEVGPALCPYELRESAHHSTAQHSTAQHSTAKYLKLPLNRTAQSRAAPRSAQPNAEQSSAEQRTAA